LCRLLGGGVLGVAAAAPASAAGGRLLRFIGGGLGYGFDLRGRLGLRGGLGLAAAARAGLRGLGGLVLLGGCLGGLGLGGLLRGGLFAPLPASARAPTAGGGLLGLLVRGGLRWRGLGASGVGGGLGRGLLRLGTALAAAASAAAGGALLLPSPGGLVRADLGGLLSLLRGLLGGAGGVGGEDGGGRGGGASAAGPPAGGGSLGRGLLRGGLLRGAGLGCRGLRRGLGVLLPPGARALHVAAAAGGKLLLGGLGLDLLGGRGRGEVAGGALLDAALGELEELRDVVREVGEVEERVLLLADVYEGGLDAGEDAADLGEVDVAEGADVIRVLDVELDERAVLDDGDPGLIPGYVDDDFLGHAGGS
jgi:hypothetical protein